MSRLTLDITSYLGSPRRRITIHVVALNSEVNNEETGTSLSVLLVEYQKIHANGKDTSGSSFNAKNK
jgi:hypothetical protein